jgi:hypothetical protein
VVERGADVAFEPPELVDERGLVSAEVDGGGFDGGEGHGGLEAEQPVPALEAVFDGAADVARDVVAEPGDHFWSAVYAGWPGRDVVAAGGDHDHDVEAEFAGDVGAVPRAWVITLR